MILRKRSGRGMMDPPMIEFRHVSKAYATRNRPKVVLRDFSLVLPKGSKVGVLGRNGAGKTTLSA